MDIMSKLTNREQEVVSLLVSGKRQSEIARILCVSRRTVDVHMYNARAKTNCNTSIELAVKASREIG